MIDDTRERFVPDAASYDVLFDTVGKTPQVLGGASNFHWGQEDLALIATLLEAGALRPVIDRTYPLEKASDAHRYVERGHKRGNVVLTSGAS